MAKEDSGTGSPIMDVAHPGTSMPSSSAKPIIVTNRAVIQDPMVSSPSEDKEAPSSAPLLEPAPQDHGSKLAPSQKKKVIVPVSEPSADAPTTAKSVSVNDTSDTTEVPVVAADSIPAVKPAEVPSVEPESSTVEKESDKEPVKEAAPPKPAAAEAPAEPTAKPADEAEEDSADTDTVPPPDEKQLAAEAAAAAKIADLVKQEKYVLPINAVERRRSKQIVVAGLLLIILLALVWLDLAADAGFIHMPGLPLTHFFRV
jgi:hypothetical protein